MQWTLQELADKAEWEGGFADASEWFPSSGAPPEFRELYQRFVKTLDLARDLEEDVQRFLERAGVVF